MPPVDPDVPRFLCCNGDESEPGTFKDRQILEFNPHSLIEGAVLANYAITAKACYIYVRGEYALWIEHLERALAEAYEKGYVGDDILGSGFSTDIVVHKGAGAYICGEETSLMESLEGKRGYPRVKPPFPAQKGIWGYPTTINNVETLAHVPGIVNRGAEWFAGGRRAHPPGPDDLRDLRARRPPRRLRVPHGHAHLGPHLRGLRGDARREEAEGHRPRAAPRRPPSAGRTVRRRDDGRRQPPRGRLDDGDGRDADHGRGHRHGRVPPPDHPLLPPRVLRAVHPLPRGHRVAREARLAHRRRGGQPPRPRPPPRPLRPDGGPHHLRPRRRRRVARPLDHPALPRGVRGEVPLLQFCLDLGSRSRTSAITRRSRSRPTAGSATCASACPCGTARPGSRRPTSMARRSSTSCRSSSRAARSTSPTGWWSRPSTRARRSPEGQEDTLEFLLINHPLDCPICDQAGHCPLQNQAYKYGPRGAASSSRRSTSPSASSSARTWSSTPSAASTARAARASPTRSRRADSSRSTTAATRTTRSPRRASSSTIRTR
jgi:hypothetical protein